MKWKLNQLIEIIDTIIKLPGQAKIGHFDHVFRTNQTVSGCQITMDIIMALQVSHSFANLLTNTQINILYSNKFKQQL